MKLPRDLTGRELVQLLCSHWDYHVDQQSGSHILLVTETPTHQRVPVPNHKPLRVGTLHAILTLVARHKGVDVGTLLAS